MSNNIYKVTETIGTSETSIEEAINGAIERKAETVRDRGWFNATEMRGHVVDDTVGHFQVTLKAGFHVQ